MKDYLQNTYEQRQNIISWCDLIINTLPDEHRTRLLFYISIILSVRNIKLKNIKNQSPIFINIGSIKPLDQVFEL